MHVQVLDSPEPLRNLADLIAAQLEYHKKAYEILSELAPVVDGLQVEQEVGNSPLSAPSSIITNMNRQTIARAAKGPKYYALSLPFDYPVLIALA